MSDGFFIPTLSILGVGLIGGSLASALKKAGVVGHVIGVGRTRTNLDRALELGVVDEVVLDLSEAIERADVVVLATPVDTMDKLFESIAPHLNASKVVTDVGSVKGGVVDAAKRRLGDQFGRFVPGHPIAGKEKSGVGAASASLFVDHKVVLTPDDETDPDASARIERMWREAGADVRTMNVVTHDRVLSITSHLPHILAYSMMNLLADSDESSECYQMAAGGFYDFTRIASSDPVMWRDISLMNRRELLAHIDRFQAELSTVSQWIKNGQSEALRTYFSTANANRGLVVDHRKPRT